MEFESPTAGKIPGNFRPKCSGRDFADLQSFADEKELTDV